MLDKDGDNLSDEVSEGFSSIPFPVIYNQPMNTLDSAIYGILIKVTVCKLY